MRALSAHPFAFPLLAAVLLLAWSSGFVGIRYATEVATVPQVLFWRSAVSGLVLLPFALAIGPRLTVADVGEQAIHAFFGMVLYLGGFALAIGYRVPTGLVALMSDIVPLAIAALSVPILGQRLTARQWAGTALALLGVLIVTADGLRLGSAPPLAYALPALGMLSFAVATVWQQRNQQAARVGGLAIHQRLCLQCLWAALAFGLIAGAGDGLAVAPTGAFVFGIVWLVGLATLTGWGLYYLALRHWPAARVSAVIYLSPPLTALWSFAAFGEPLGWSMALGMAVTLAGVVLVTAPARGAWTTVKKR